MKKLITSLLTLCLLMNLLLPSMTAAAAEKPSFRLRAEKNGETVTVTVSLNGDVENAGGLHLSLSYDESVFSYTAGSRKLLLSALSTLNLNRDTAASGVIHFTGDATTGFAVKGDIVSYQFNILSAQAGEKTFSLKVKEFYYSDAALSGVKLASTKASATITLADDRVQNVTELIDGIGTVTLESEAKIQAARAAYNALSIQQKRQVKNLETLTNAEARLTALQAEAGKSSEEKQAAAFRKKYEGILAKTTQTLALEDEQSIQAALLELGNQELSVRAILNPERNYLKRLETRITELKKLAADALAEEALKKEAQEMAESFKKQWKSFLELDVSKVTDAYLEALTQAIGTADSNALVNSWFMDYVQVEYDHLLALKAAIADSVKNESSDAAADRFISNFSYLLTMKPEDVTRAEETDVRAALIVYEMLSDEAKKLIGSDTNAKLTELLALIEALPTEGTNGSGSMNASGETQIIYKDRVIYQTVAGDEGQSAGKEGKSLVQIATQGIPVMVWWLLLTLFITVLLSGLAAGMLAFVRKKNRNYTEKGDEVG